MFCACEFNKIIFDRNPINVNCTCIICTPLNADREKNLLIIPIFLKIIIYFGGFEKKNGNFTTVILSVFLLWSTNE